MTQDRIAGFGFCTAGATPDLLDLDRALGVIEDTGASHAELSLCSAHILAGATIVPVMRRRLEAACARRKLAYTVHGALTVNLMDEPNLAHHRAVAAAMLELCAAVGATVMVHHTGLVAAAPAETIDRLHALERDELARLGDRAGQLGVRVAVETLFVERADRYTADPFRLAAELARLDHPHVVGTLDLSHSFIMSRFRGLDPEAAVRAFAPVAGHVHLHDSFGRPTTVESFYTTAERIAFGMGDLHLPLGWGDLPLDRLLPDLPFRPGTALIVELPDRFWAELVSCAAAAARLAAACNAAARG
jgi:sugar phosphate isomerase/epimerase